jgi:hypothetical protein
MNQRERQKFANLHESLRECKRRLPLPEVWRRLGLPGQPRKSCHSPFREDRNASFSVFEHGELWFWRDHALDIGGDEVDFLMHGRGCDKDDAIRAYHELAGVAMPRKSGKRAGYKAGKLVKFYDYLDAAGRLKHQTLRYEPKRFLQRRPAAPGMRAGSKVAKCDREGNWWLWTLHGIEPVLYHLPQIIGAGRDTPIYLCEGEKDADALVRAWNVVTTTAPMGAGKWRPSYTETLRDRDVILWPDRDPAGEKHMEPLRKRSIRSLRVCELWIGTTYGQRPPPIQRASSMYSIISTGANRNERGIIRSQRLRARHRKSND